MSYKDARGSVLVYLPDLRRLPKPPAPASQAPDANQAHADHFAAQQEADAREEEEEPSASASQAPEPERLYRVAYVPEHVRTRHPNWTLQPQRYTLEEATDEVKRLSDGDRLSQVVREEWSAAHQIKTSDALLRRVLERWGDESDLSNEIRAQLGAQAREPSDRAAYLLQRVTDYRAECEREEYTDTGELWELVDALAEHIRGA